MSKNEKTSKRGTARRHGCRGGYYVVLPKYAKVALTCIGCSDYRDSSLGFRLVEEVIDEKD